MMFIELNENFKVFNNYNPTLVIVLVVLGIGLVIFFLVVYLRVKANEMKIRSSAWKIQYSELEFIRNVNNMKSSSRTLNSNVSGSNDDKNFMSIINFHDIEEGHGELNALYRGTVVTVNYSSKQQLILNKKDLTELSNMKDLVHDNLINFIGACTEHERVCFVTQFCSRGKLQDLIADPNTNLDWAFKLSFITDIIKGIRYLHKSPLHYHGQLTSNCCLIDARWVLKITGFGLENFREGGGEDRGQVNLLNEKLNQERDEEKYCAGLLWTAPELLRQIGTMQDSKGIRKGSQKGDVYSFAIIVHEIIYMAFPYSSSSLSFKEIIQHVKSGQLPAFRSPLTLPQEADVNHSILNIISQCWEEDPDLRPSFDALEKQAKQFNNGKLGNIVDSMLEKLEKYANNLESIVQQRTQELVEEKKKTDRLLHSMLPPFIADELKRGKKVEPQMYEKATVYFSDIVGFTTLSSESTPMQIVDFLNDLYGSFDDTIAKHKVYKVETIGDAYMVVSGLPEINLNHVFEICNMALDLLGIVQTFKIRHRPDMMLMLRIGIHSGPCAAGVVGHTMPRYCLFGDTVNVASRMESNGEALKIHISTQAKDLLVVRPGYITELRGEIELKGKGAVTTYWLIKKE